MLTKRSKCRRSSRRGSTAKCNKYRVHNRRKSETRSNEEVEEAEINKGPTLFDPFR